MILAIHPPKYCSLGAIGNSTPAAKVHLGNEAAADRDDIVQDGVSEDLPG